MKDYYIKTKDLSVGYQGKVLIRDINLDIKKGEIVTLIGPNGAGKSTILKSVTRQFTVTNWVLPPLPQQDFTLQKSLCKE